MACPRAFLVAAAAALLTVLAACTGDPAPGESPTPTASPKPPPRAGQCFRPTEEQYARHVDAGRPVDCAREHTLESARVLTSEEPITADNVDRYAEACRAGFERYVGGPDDVSRLDLHFMVADEKTQASGSHWIRCDVAAMLDTEGSVPQPRTGSVADSLADGAPGELRACLNSPPRPSQKQRYVPCDDPHVAQLVPRSVRLGAVDEAFPSQETLAARAERACTRLARARAYPTYAGLNWAFPSKETWAAGDRTGSCWVSARLPGIDDPTPEPSATAAPTPSPTPTPTPTPSPR